MRRNTLVFGVVLLILAIFAWAGWANWEYRQQETERRLASAAKGELVPSAGSESVEYKSPLLGKAAPAFALEDLNGQKVSLASYKGKAVLVNFWATWCTPCAIETPWLIELRNKYAAQGFEVLGVDTEGDDVKPSDKDSWAKDKAAAAQFAKKMKVPYPMLLGGDSIGDLYGGVDSLPASFFVNREGKVVAATMGINAESDIETDIKKALAE